MSRLRTLFQRYSDCHFELRQSGGPLPGPAGYLDQITHTGRGLVLEGWTEADSIVARSGGQEAAAAPSLDRIDVAQARGGRTDVGFRLVLPDGDDRLEIEVTARGRRWTQQIAAPAPRAWRMAQWQTVMRFAADLARAAPHLPNALLRADPQARARVKTCLRLDAEVAGKGPMETRLFDLGGRVQGPLNTPITIILPVYNAYDLLCEALAHLAEHTDLPWHLVLVDDASPDPRVRPYLRDWAAVYGDCVTLLENDTNLGFIGSVNRGFEVARARGHHVVLLNSDAFVPAGWASRLIAPMLRHRNIASVTPMSNDATILNVPVVSQRTDLKPGVAAQIDSYARRIHPEALLSVLPTGVGFCMAMNIEYLTRVPQFDPSFGRGYGEEVDWCQKTRALGGRHLGLPSLFVEHRGGESFGSEAKRALVARNNRIVSSRYPSFDAEVRAFVDRDPLATARLALGMAQTGGAAGDAVPVYIAHFMGGGAENYVQARIRGDLMRGQSSIVLRVGGPHRWRVELHCEEGVTRGDTDDFGFVKALLAPITQRQVIYSCAVGDPDPVAIPDLVLEIAREGTADRLEILMHDYFPLSPSYTLLDRDMIYRGPVEAGRRDKAHMAVRPDGRVVGLEQWRAAWGRLLLAAQKVVVFSDDSRRQVQTIYPWIGDRLTLIPHRLLHPVGRVRVAPDAPQVIGVLGSIGAQKGAGIVARLATRLAGSGRIVLIGCADPSFDMPDTVTVTGAYRPQDIAKIAAKHGVTRWLIPSIWPETFSYTTHEALATGLPVHAFAIGGQGEAVRAAPNGIAVPFDPNGDLVSAVLRTLNTKAKPGTSRAVA